MIRRPYPFARYAVALALVGCLGWSTRLYVGGPFTLVDAATTADDHAAVAAALAAED